ncbi:MAG: stage II sporulation protein R, partial [Oscillospiraceae bacterium]|nr:stage II sporulation protein R [Oscillospiraceae bacterium]
SSSLLRLHVLAHSNAAEEQSLKLEVRDAVLEYISPRLEVAQTVAQAREILRAELDNIGLAAAEAARGRKVSVSLDRENYPTKAYEGFRLPAGNYESLRVVLGEGEGQNWWCIVFPPVCLSAVQSEPVAAVMNRDDYALVSSREGWELRFKTVEIWGELCSMFSSEG